MFDLDNNSPETFVSDSYEFGSLAADYPQLGQNIRNQQDNSWKSKSKRSPSNFWTFNKFLTLAGVLLGIGIAFHILAFLAILIVAIF